MTLRNALAEAAEELRRHGVPTPRTDAEILLGHALGLTRVGLYADGTREIRSEEAARIAELIARRSAREPLAYIIGEWGFRRLTLTVDRRALIPRAETEIVVERCLELLAPIPRPSVLDVGVGTGAIALALADEHPGAEVTAIDVSTDALALARENAERTGLSARVHLLHRDVADGLPARSFDLVVANPPYVTPEELPALEPEVREWEPREALVAAALHERIADAARIALRTGGWIVLEVGAGQAEPVRLALLQRGYSCVVVTPDLAGIDRIVSARVA